MDEVRAVPSIPYLGVTRDGRVMNMISGKLLSICDNGHGYKQVFICVKNKHYMRYVHRLVAECYLPNPNNLAEVNHKDGNKANNNVDNLEWCTRSENLKHAIRTGLKPPNSDRQRKAASEVGKRSIHYARAGWKEWAKTDEAKAVWLSNIEGYNKQKHAEVERMTQDERREKYNARKRKYYAEHIETEREKSRVRHAIYVKRHRDEINKRAREKYALEHGIINKEV